MPLGGRKRGAHAARAWREGGGGARVPPAVGSADTGTRRPPDPVLPGADVADLHRGLPGGAGALHRVHGWGPRAVPAATDVAAARAGPDATRWRAAEGLASPWSPVRLRWCPRRIPDGSRTAARARCSVVDHR